MGFLRRFVYPDAVSSKGVKKKLFKDVDFKQVSFYERPTSWAEVDLHSFVKHYPLISGDTPGVITIPSQLFTACNSALPHLEEIPKKEDAFGDIHHELDMTSDSLRADLCLLLSDQIQRNNIEWVPMVKA